MLNKNNHKNLSCTFAEQVVSYLYEEIDAAEKAVFETHLAVCNACSNELADLNTAHFSLLEWKKKEFSTLEIPEIEIPYNCIERQNKTVSLSSKAHSWFINFGKIFNHKMAWSAAFAFLLGIFGLFFLVYNFTKNDETASFHNGNLSLSNVSLLAENNSLAVPAATPFTSEKQISDGRTAMQAGSEHKNIAAVGSAEEITNQRFVKISNRPAKVLSKTFVANQYLKHVGTAHKIYNSNSFAKTKMPVKIQKIPKLNQIEDDEEDATLRLSDLLESVGGK